MPRKAHKERSQPSSRKHLGLLEKKKDYIERARDFQRKVGRIKDLKKKVLEKNPDEFYYGMLKASTKGGVHEAKRDDGMDTLSHAEIRLMKDQDLTYLHMKQSVDERRAGKLQKDLHLMLDKPMNKHKIFVASQRDAAAFDPAAHFDTDAKLTGRAFNRPRKAALEGRSDDEGVGGRDGDAGFAGSEGGGKSGGVVSGAHTMKQLKKVMKQRDKSYAELAQRLARATKLKRLANRKEVQKQVMNSKGAKRKVKDAEGGKPAVYKWKRQRAK